MPRWSGVYILLAILCSIRIRQTQGLSLTEGNLLILRYNYNTPQPSGKYIAEIAEISSTDGSIAQSWSLTLCEYAGNSIPYGRITFSYNYAMATVFCRKGTDFYVYKLTNDGVITSTPITNLPASEKSALSAVMDDNDDIWLASGDQDATPITTKLHYTTLGSTSYTEVLSSTGALISGLQIINDTFYFGYSGFSLTNSVLYVGNLPKTAADLAGSAVVVSNASVYFYAMSTSEAYTSTANIIAKHKDGVPLYNINAGYYVNGVTAQTLNGVRTVYAAIFEAVYYFVDSGSQFETDAYWSYSGYTVLEVTAIGQYQPPTCSDQRKNQDETDVDCGGVCIKCEISKKCKVNADCVTDYCDNLVCAELIPVAPPQPNSPQSNSPQASNTPTGSSPKPVQSPKGSKVSTAGTVVIQISIGAALALLAL